MCFSATASFATVAITGIAGAAAVMRAGRREDLVLAATPLFFAAQQAIEGMLWLTLPVSAEGPVSARLTLAFLLFAKVFWPVYAPLAALFVEPEVVRRRMMAGCLAAGIVAAGYCLWSLAGHAYGARIVEGHIVYSGEPPVPFAVSLAYLVATGGAPAFSSHPAVKLFAAIVITGMLVSYFFYWEAFSSVWCFFAAAASAVIVFHFERARQMRQAMAESA